VRHVPALRNRNPNWIVAADVHKVFAKLGAQAYRLDSDYGVDSGVEGLVAAAKDELAAIIIEPFQRIIPPDPGFLEGVRKLTADNGIVLIFDEVVTGFRLAYGGAQAYYGVTPDICTMGKAIGGGFPLAALGGRADIMAHFDQAAVGDDGFVMQVGTLSGNPVAAAAGLATLEILREPGAYDKLFATGQTLMDALDERLKQAGIQATVSGVPPLFDIVFASGPVRDYRATFHQNKALSKVFNDTLRAHGIFKSDSKFYISLAHDEADIAQTIDAIDETIEFLVTRHAAIITAIRPHTSRRLNLGRWGCSASDPSLRRRSASYSA